MPPTVSDDRAQTIALQGVAYLLQEPQRLDGFLSNSGCEAGDFRTRLSDPAFLASICAYLLSDDAMTVDFCRGLETHPDELHRVRHHLEQCGSDR